MYNKNNLVVSALDELASVEPQEYTNFKINEKG